RRSREGQLALADDERRRTAAVVQGDLLLGAMADAKGKAALPTPDRHPAKGLPGRAGLRPRGALLLIEDRGDRGAQLKLARRSSGLRQAGQFAFDEAGIDVI